MKNGLWLADSSRLSILFGYRLAHTCSPINIQPFTLSETSMSCDLLSVALCVAAAPAVSWRKESSAFLGLVVFVEKQAHNNIHSLNSNACGGNPSLKCLSSVAYPAASGNGEMVEMSSARFQAWGYELCIYQWSTISWNPSVWQAEGDDSNAFMLWGHVDVLRAWAWTWLYLHPTSPNGTNRRTLD